MSIIKNKYVNKFISGGNTPAFPPSHTPGELVVAEIPPEAASLAASLAPPPPGWVLQWEPNAQRIYYLEQATGRTQWVPPDMSRAPIEYNAHDYDDSASIMSGTTASPSIFSGTTAHSPSIFSGRTAHSPSTFSGTTEHSNERDPKWRRALQWRALPDQPRTDRKYMYMNLPTRLEREYWMREVAEKRAREGPPKPDNLGRKVMRKINLAGDSVGSGIVFGL
ncbi:hypothetical protein DE146DRAFT_732547 [Phaeosphaeria sp. MPI-PUGE-AT-0046c]|nr:hypothetical protein DE146DRAFT_732547 [Phaeosphaeria sp. MPI-PUGE-AT-0046c]